MNKTRLNRNSIEQSKVIRFLVLIFALLTVCNASAQTASRREGANTGQTGLRKDPSPHLRNRAQQVGAIYVPQKISNVKVQESVYECSGGKAYVVFTFSTSQATVPVINVLKRPPDAKLDFKPSDVVSSKFPVLSGKLTQHKIRVENLRAGRQYYYVITAGGSAKNDQDRATGKVQTVVNFDEDCGDHN